MAVLYRDFTIYTFNTVFAMTDVDIWTPPANDYSQSLDSGITRQAQL